MRKRYWLTIIVVSLVFYAVYAGSFYLLHGFLDTQFDASAPDLLGLKNFGMVHGGNTREIFSAYGAVMGLGFLAFGLVNSFFFWGILALVRLGKNIYARLINMMFVYGVMLGIAIEFVFFEERTTEISRSIIFYMGYPMLYASAVAMVVIAGIGLYSILKKVPKSAKAHLAFLTLALFGLSGCNVLGEMTAITCSFGIDDTHCYQEAAIQQNDPADCEKVKQPEQFKDAGSNPPKDKCYMIVAENRKDPTICGRIIGGMFSYEKGDCIQEIAEETRNYDTCKQGATNLQECMQAIADKDLQDTAKLIESVKASSAPEEEKLLLIQSMLARGAKEYESLSNIQKQMYDMQAASVRNLR
jgi:hypothetical protein